MASRAPTAGGGGSTPAPSFASRAAIPAAAALLALAAFLAYRNSFFGPFIFDDAASIPDNATIRKLWPLWLPFEPASGGLTVSGRPLLNFSFALNYAISGTRVWSYHVFNLAFHFLAGLTLFDIVRRTMLRRRRAGLALRHDGSLAAHPWAFALAAALLWTLHPLQTEAVTYVVQRAESLMGLFFLLTLYGFIRWAETDKAQTRARRGWFAVALAACLLGDATKEVMATAPLLVFLYDRTFVSGGFGKAWRRHRSLHLALAGSWLFLGALVLANGGNRGGTIGVGVEVTWLDYDLTQFRAILRYLELTVCPHGLVFDYGPFWARHFWQVAPFALPVLILLAATAFALARAPAVGFLAAWFFVVLAPTSIAPGTIQMIVEHRMYLPLAGLLPLGLWALDAAVARIGARRVAPPLLFRISAGLALLWAAWLGAVTFARNNDYRSAIGIWSDTVAKRPGNAEAYNNLAVVLAEAGRISEAAAGYERALQLNPSFAEAHYNLAATFVREGKIEEGIAHYKEALRLKPVYPEALYGLGVVVLRQGKLAEAAALERLALMAKPDYADARSALGEALAKSGQTAEAIHQYEEAIRLQPDDALLHYNFGLVLVAANRPGEAAREFIASLQIDPNRAGACYQLGLIYVSAGHPSLAAQLFWRAIQLQPNYPEALLAFGNVALTAGHRDQAIESYERAIQAAPGLAIAHFNLATAFAYAGRMAQAAEEYERTLQIQPDYPLARRALDLARQRLGQQGP